MEIKGELAHAAVLPGDIDTTPIEDTVRHHLDPESALLSYDDLQVEPELV